jgi:hypothetical protein
MAKLVDSLARQPVDLDEFRQLMAKVAPVMRADQKRLEVLDGLASLTPAGGLIRGQSVSIVSDGAHGRGVLSLATALVARATQVDSWCAVVGIASYGVSGAMQLGLNPDRLALVPLRDAASRGEWIAVTSSLVDTCDIVLTRVPRPTQQCTARQLADGLRRLQARARQQDSVLVVVGQHDESADLRFAITNNSWHEINRGWGSLRQRRMTVRLSGKGVASSSRDYQIVFSPAGDRVVVDLENLS